MIPEWFTKYRELRKIKEQEELIRVLKRPEKEQRRRPAAKFATNRRNK